MTMEGDGEPTDAVAKAVEDALKDTDEAAGSRIEEQDADGEDDDADADADDVEAATAALVSGEPAKPPQVEVVREPLAPLQSMPALSAGPQASTSSAMPADSTSNGAQPSDNPVANALRNEQKDAESTLTAELHPQLLATLRAPIFSTSVTTTVVSPAALLESLDPEAAAALLGIEVGDLSNAADSLEPGSLSFSKMFPELPLYGGVMLPDANSKSDRRWDEGSLNQPPRLTHVTKLLDSRPLLVSTLEPSKNRANGRWLPDSDWVVAAEQSDPLRGVADGADSGLPPLPGSLLFARKSNRAAKEPITPVSTTPAEPAQPDVRAAMFMWTPDEDSYLMTLAKQYQNNWALVADLFNSTRLSTATDKREPWDCFDRCKRIEQAAAEGKPPPAPPQLPPSAAETEKDGKKGDGKDGDTSSKARQDEQEARLQIRWVEEEASSKQSDGSNAQIGQAQGSSKQAQQTQQTKKVNLNTHETHAQIKAGPAITPQSLSALKTERDQAALRQYYEQQRAQLAYQQQQQQQQRLLAQQAQAQRMAQSSTGSTPGQATTPAGQAGKAGAATSAVGANGAANLTLPVGSTAASQPGQAAQAQQKATAGQMQVPQAAPTTAPQQPPTAQMQQQQQQPTQQQQQQQQQQVQAQLQSQLQASQAAQMQNLYAQIQQQQRQQQQNQQLGQAAGMAQVRPTVGPLTQQQLSTLTPAQQQQYHAQLAAATAAAQQQQLRNQMAAVAAAQQNASGAGGLPFQLPNAQAQAQFQLMQQQQNAMQQNAARPPHMQNQAQAQAAALQLYQQQQRQAAQVQAQAQMRPPQTGQQQQFAARPNNGVRPPPVPTGTGQAKPQQAGQRPSTPTGSSPAGMPATIQALQQQLAISLATSNLSPEQINGLAIQLYKQAQTQQQGATAATGGSPSVRPAGTARPAQQILNQAIQALAAQNQKSQQATGAASPAASGGQGRPPPRDRVRHVNGNGSRNVSTLTPRLSA